jgi:hypothetical protein
MTSLCDVLQVLVLSLPTPTDVLGLIILASSTSVNAVAAGQVFYTIGNTGFDLVLTIILGDITSLEVSDVSRLRTPSSALILPPFTLLLPFSGVE